MYTSYTTSFIIKNNNRLLYKLLNDIYLKESNIINSNIFKFNNFISINLQLDIPNNEIQEFNKNINYKYKNLLNTSLSKDFNNTKEIYKNKKKFSLNIKCSDSPGIIKDTICQIIKLNGDIININSYIEPGPFNGYPYFNLKANIEIPDIEIPYIEISDSFINEVKYENKFVELEIFNNIKEKYGCDVNLY